MFYNINCNQEKVTTVLRIVGYDYGFLGFEELLEMWPCTCMIIIFYSQLTLFFCDATMYIYDDSTTLAPHSC